MTEELNLILRALNANIKPNQPDTYVDEGYLDARDYFLSVLAARLGGRTATEDIVRRYLEAPDVWEGVLVEQIQNLQLTEDKELVRAAREVIRYSDMPGFADDLG